MAAFALWAKERGITVTGSDVDEHFPSDDMLLQKHIDILSGFDATHISESLQPDLVVYTGAHQGKSNVEVERAIQLGIPILAHGEALGFAMSTKRQVSVAGSHGKTTTSAMIASILMVANMDPSYAIGCGQIRGLGFPGHFGAGEFFVAEADEYITDPIHDKTPRFLWQSPEFLVVTNIDFDHPDAYKDLSSVKDAFVSLQKQMVGKKVSIINADDPESSILIAGAVNGVAYGVSNDATYRIDSITYGDGKTSFSIIYNDTEIGVIELQIPGAHNILNATAAAVLALQIGVPWEKIRFALSTFGGAKRRFEFLCEKNHVRYYDDYAHHPKEIRATLQAARSWFPKRRVIAIFQPHTYSRTKSFIDEFSESFIDADVVLLSDIYASAREKDTYGISGNTLFEKTKKFHKHVFFVPKKEDVTLQLQSCIHEGDVVIFMGAGDIFSWEGDIIQAL